MQLAKRHAPLVRQNKLGRQRAVEMRVPLLRVKPLPLEVRTQMMRCQLHRFKLLETAHDVFWHSWQLTVEVEVVSLLDIIGSLLGDEAISASDHILSHQFDELEHVADGD